MHNLDLILTITGGLIAALLMGYGTHRAGLSPIVGYLLAGILVGPHTPGFVANQGLAEQLAEIGVILLMFGVGLHFHLDHLLSVRRVAVPGAVVQSIIATILAALVARLFGWDWNAGIVFGLAISVASTVVMVRVLTDQHDLHTPTGHIAVGWLVVEDLFTVVILVLLPAIFGGDAAEQAQQSGATRILMALGLTALKITALVAIVFIVGGRFIPWLLERVAATRSRELFTLTVLAVALGIAVGSAKVFGVSMALGAFLAGMVVGRSEFSLRAAAEALPMRDAFAVLFFVSVGMLFNPSHLIEAPGLVIATLAVVMIGKPLAALGVVLLLKYPLRVGLSVAIALAQIGEFSFILATVGKDLKILDDAATNTLIAASIVSITLNPLLYKLVRPMERWFMAQPRLARWLKPAAGATASSAGAEPARPADNERGRAIIVGFGPVGQTVARLLRDNQIVPTVIELNLDTVRRLRGDGVLAVYGDAGNRDTLHEAGVATADSLILSAAGMQGSEEVIRQARQMNPNIHVLARSTFVRDLPALRSVGAEVALSDEGEIALAFTTAILERSGSSPRQIDRERERVHAEVLGQPRMSQVLESPQPLTPADSAARGQSPASETSPVDQAAAVEPSPRGDGRT